MLKAERKTNMSGLPHERSAFLTGAMIDVLTYLKKKKEKTKKRTFSFSVVVFFFQYDFLTSRCLFCSTHNSTGIFSDILFYIVSLSIKTPSTVFPAEGKDQPKSVYDIKLNLIVRQHF